MDKGLAWEVFLQGLDVTGGELVNGATNGARKECENPLTSIKTTINCTISNYIYQSVLQVFGVDLYFGH